jgi:acetyl-CoA acetyltransferase
MTQLMEKLAIVSGLGISETGRAVGRSNMDLALDASLAAIADAGLRVEDIDGLASMGDAPVDAMHESLGLQTRWVGGGAALSGAQLYPIMSACMAVATGMCRHVLVYRSVKQISGDLVGGPAGEWEWHIPFHEYTAASIFAMHARRHMHLYGTTKEQLGWIAVTCRAHAARNPKAAKRDPMTMDDYLAVRPIAEPFGLYDCDIPVDGAVALVVSRRDYGPDCPQSPVGFEAIGCAVDGRASWDQRFDYPAMSNADAAAQMWSRTDLKPGDVDVAQIYDGFTFLTLSWLEALGFCKVGEGGAFVDQGKRITLGGELPLNTYGGQLSAGRLHGYWLVHEAVTQLRGQAEGRQVDGCEVAVMSAAGAPNTGCMLFTRG